jgi:PAS domain S-box-containing protein
MAGVMQHSRDALMPDPDGSGARVVGLDPIPARILVVDDDQRNLFAVEEMLRAPGIDIVLADSGEAALRRVLQDDFAVVLLDVQMPRIDGFEVASMIRTRPRSSRVPIIFLTAFNKDDLHIFRGYTAGAVDYVFKPIEPLILRSKVDVFVDLYRKTEEIRRQGEEERRLLVENLRVRGEKLAAEQALRRREEHQSLVLRSLPIALYTAALEEDHRQLRFTNDSIHEITGFTPPDFLVAPEFWADRLHPEDRERVLSALQAIRETGSVALEYRWRCADGSERHVLDQAVLMRDDDGRPREFFGMWLDISDRKQMEQNLLHASKLEAVGRLTGGIAHDFNNMLSVVIGNLDLLQNAIEGNEKASRRARLAMEGAQRCADLTNRLLSFSRRQPLQTSVINLRDLVPGMLELLQRTLGERIEVHLDAGEDLWPVEVDPTQFEAALVNLAVNARDAMPDGGDLTVAMRNARVEDAGSGACEEIVVVSVRDTGTGMPPSVRERVFEPFFTTKESGKGTGLGLSMVYGFAQQSGGRIEIDSEPGEGTTVRVFLPRAHWAEKAEAVEHAPPGAAIRGSGERLLVVEDDEDVRHVTVSALESLGFRVIEAEDGDEALARLMADSSVDLIVTDVKMPGSLTGTDLARRVRSEWPWIRILLTSGYVDAEEELGSFDVLFKPYRVAELAKKVQEVLTQPPEVDLPGEPAPARVAAAGWR